jgi:hypothetical protein
VVKIAVKLPAIIRLVSTIYLVVNHEYLSA